MGNFRDVGIDNAGNNVDQIDQKAERKKSYLNERLTREIDRLCTVVDACRINDRYCVILECHSVFSRDPLQFSFNIISTNH